MIEFVMYYYLIGLSLTLSRTLMVVLNVNGIKQMVIKTYEKMNAIPTKGSLIASIIMSAVFSLMIAPFTAVIWPYVAYNIFFRKE